MTNPIFQRSADARFLIQKLKASEVGETITYADLAEAIGKSQDALHGPLHTARRALLRDENMVFGTVRGKGVKRLSDLDIVAASASTTRHLKRTARRGVQTLSAVSDFSAMPREEQMRHSAAMSIFGAIAEMTTEKAIAKIEAKVEKHALPFAQTLEAFK